MDITIVTTIITVVGTLAGAVIGSVLTHHYDKQSRKVKLCFKLQASEDENEIDSEYKTKTSPSDYCIVVYNIGQTPFILEQISLRHKKIGVITDCIIEGETLMPYESFSYQLNKQEYDSILYHCKQSDIKKCSIVAYDVGGKACKSELDLFLPHMQSGFR